LGRRTARSFREDQRKPRVSTRVASSEGQELVQDVYCQVIGAVLLQEEDGKEFLVAYVSQRLLDAETRYVLWNFFEYLYIMRAPSLVIISFLVLA
jgi:hypothetical protein